MLCKPLIAGLCGVYRGGLNPVFGSIGQVGKQVSGQQKYRFFVSSTYTDLVKSRQALMLSLLKMGHFPVGMELYPTEENQLWAEIQQQINDCDYYIVLVGGRYGSRSPMGLSYTHREYTYAATRKKPILALMHDQPESLPAQFRETTPAGMKQLQAFRTLLAKGNMSREWNRLEELRSLVTTVVPQLISRYPKNGWVRENAAGSAVGGTPGQMQIRIKELEQKLHRTKASSASTGSFPRSETVPVGYQCDVYMKGNCKLMERVSYPTWGKVVSSMASHLQTQVKEDGLKRVLKECIAGMALKDIQRKYPQAHAVSNIRISPDSFAMIKKQLQSMDVIGKQVSTASIGVDHWGLTAYGKQVMKQLRSRPARMAQ